MRPPVLSPPPLFSPFLALPFFNLTVNALLPLFPFGPLNETLDGMAPPPFFLSLAPCWLDMQAFFLVTPSTFFLATVGSWRIPCIEGIRPVTRTGSLLP